MKKCKHFLSIYCMITLYLYAIVSNFKASHRTLAALDVNVQVGTLLNTRGKVQMFFTKGFQKSLLGFENLRV